jgi:hypothetical protein
MEIAFDSCKYKGVEFVNMYLLNEFNRLSYARSVQPDSRSVSSITLTPKPLRLRPNKRGTLVELVQRSGGQYWARNILLNSFYA